MTARMDPAPAPFSGEVQRWLERTMPPGVAPLRLFTTLARDARLFEKIFSGGLVDRGHLALREREIVIDRITALCGCEYEWGVHVAFFAQRVGFGEEHLRSLAHGHAADPCWSHGECLLIQMCDQLHSTCALTDGLWEALRAGHSDEALLELLMLAGYYRTISYLANGLKLPAESFGARFPARVGTTAAGH